MGLFDFARRKKEEPDLFEAHVRDLVQMFGPFDALERDNAMRLATRVLMNSLLQLHEALSAGAPVTPTPPSAFRRSLERSTAPVAAWVREHGVTDAEQVGQRIAQTCFGDDDTRRFLDTGEIPWLMGVAHGVALDLWNSERELAQQLLEPKEEVSAEGSDLSPLEHDLVRRLVEYGQTSDETLVPSIMPVYERATVELTSEQRSNMLLWLIEQVGEKSHLSGNALMPFLFKDTDWQIISTAALHVAALWPESDQDPLIGVREIAGWARRYARQGDEERAAALFAGLALLGDRRILDCIGPCWRSLSTDARVQLSRGVAGRTYAGLIDWLITWLEECEGHEFGAVAAALTRIPSYTQPAEVVDVQRALPVWSVERDAVIRVLNRWSFEEYGGRIRRRLLQVAADEVAPRVMHDVLKSWTINHMQREAAGVAMRARGGVEPSRPLIPLLPGGARARSGLLDACVALRDDDFAARDGRLLLCWAIFNPYGPTWSSVGLLPTEDPSIEILFYRMLNPFGQQSAAVGVVQSKERDTGAVVSSLVEDLFTRQTIPSADGGEEIYLIGNGVPDVIQVVWNDERFAAAAERAFRLAPRLRELDVVRAVRQIRECKGRPWDRTAAQREAMLKRMTPEGLILPLPHEGETTDSIIGAWLSLVTERDHWLPELVNFPGAWHGAIDHANSALAQNAFTFWQLDDFLARYGYASFREIAADMDPEGAETGDAPASDTDAPPVADSAKPTLALPASYREAYERLRAQLRGIDYEGATAVARAKGLAASMVALQLASAEHHLVETSVDTRALRRLMHQPWALGYVSGAAFAMIEACEISRGTHDADTVVTTAHQSGIPGISTAEVIDLTGAAGERPGFEDGMLAAGQDAVSVMREGEHAQGLLHWLMEESERRSR